MTPYDDDYPTCRRTTAQLRIFSDSLDPGYITSLLGVFPTESFAKGDKFGKRQLTRKFNGWFLSTADVVNSKDCRRHIDWVVSKLASCGESLEKLRSMGAEIDLSCLWLSSGQGGPVLSPSQMTELARLNIEIWWDVYFEQEELNSSGDQLGE